MSIVASTALYFSWKNLQKRTADTFENISEQVYKNVELLMDKSFGHIDFIAKYYADSKDRFSEEKLKHYKNMTGMFNDITIIDTEGNVLLSSDYNFIGDWNYKRNYLKALKGEKALNPPVFKKNGNGEAVTSIAVPVYKGDVVEAVVAAQLHMSLINEIVSNAEMGKSGRALMVDGVGRIIAHSDTEKLFNKIPETFVEKLGGKDRHLNFSMENKEFTGTFYPVGPKFKIAGMEDWKLIFAEESMVIVKMFKPEFIFVFLFSLLLFLFAVLFGFIFAGTITEPVEKLKKATQKIAEGDYSQKVPVYRKDELGELSSSFNSMVSQIKSARFNMKSAVKRFRNLSEMLPLAVVETDVEGRVLYANRFAIKLNINRDEKNLFGRIENISKSDNLHPEDVLNPRKMLKEDFILRSENEKEDIPVDIYMSEITHKEKVVGYRMVVIDVTEHHNLQKQLEVAQKMETLGTLADGIAHDFNNNLNIITGSVSLLKHASEQGDLSKKELEKRIDVIGISAENSARLVRQLMSISRKKRSGNTEIDLNMSVKQVLKLVTDSVDKSVDIDVEYFSGISFVKGDPVLLEQVFLNLIMNAIHAVTIMRKEGEPYGGNVFIKIFPEERNNKKYWCISIEDNGVGIEAGLREKIFDPFFTLKKKKGTGLGLTMVYSIVKQCGGHISLRSVPGKGSVFTLMFPRLETKVEIDKKSPEKIVEKGSGKILLLENDFNLLHTAKRMLNTCGYTVTAVGQPVEAIEAFEKSPDSFDLVIMSMSLPVLSGDAVFEKIRKIKNDIKILISSGKPGDSRIHKIMDNPNTALIDKPYSVYEISRKVSSFINKKN
ncbi:MAG: ATP-binding protein [bacterium]